MTQKDKELLLVDLCARLPYGVKFTSFSENMKYHSEPTTLRQIFYNEEYDANNIEGDNDISSILDLIKPYLRPMSSMTEEEYEDYNGIAGFGTYEQVMEDRLDWLLSHHFDFRGLIPMGLANEAPKGMYNIE